ncbi:MAG: hypothetical protein R3F19_14145 [Verrucomicrobiales bacterium]
MRPAPQRLKRPNEEGAAKKKAVVATARKLGVLLHTLWVRQTDYIPLRPVPAKETDQAAVESSDTNKATKVIAA